MSDLNDGRDSMKKYKVGYTQGTYDLFHIGHLNLLKHAKEQCEYLIVGINTDKLVSEYKCKVPVINENDRAKIVEAIKYVDEVIITDTLDKLEIYNRKKFDVVFIGNDWKGSSRWNKTVDDLKKIGIEVIFLPHTDGVSTTQITTHLLKGKNNNE